MNQTRVPTKVYKLPTIEEEEVYENETEEGKIWYTTLVVEVVEVVCENYGYGNDKTEPNMRYKMHDIKKNTPHVPSFKGNKYQ